MRLAARRRPAVQRQVHRRWCARRRRAGNGRSCWRRGVRRSRTATGTCGVSAAAASTRRNRRALSWIADSARIASTTRTTAGTAHRRRRRHERRLPRCRNRRRGARARRSRGRSERLVPEGLAGIVVDCDRVVHAGDDRQRREQRDAVDGHALHGRLQAALAFEPGSPLKFEAGLRERSAEIFGSDRIQFVRCASPSAVGHSLPMLRPCANSATPGNHSRAGDQSVRAMRITSPRSSTGSHRTCRGRRGRWQWSIR